MSASKEFTMAEVEAQSSNDSLYIVIDNGVYNVTEFLGTHPGGPKILKNVSGKDASVKFRKYHNDSEKILVNTAAQYRIGTVKA